MQRIPRPLHGILDYICAVFLIVSPWVLGFQYDEPVRADMARIFGGGLAIYTALTNFEVGIVRLIPFPVHLVFDLLLGLALLASPIIFSVGGKAAIVFVCVGIFEIAMAAMTRGAGWPRGGFPSWT